MHPKVDWRSAAAYAYVNDLTPAELAWEFLRRNPNYQREFRTAVSQIPEEEEIPEESARPWGLRFPDRPGPPRGYRAAALAAAH